MSIGIIASSIESICPLTYCGGVKEHLDKILEDSILVVDKLNKVFLSSIDRYSQMIVLSDKARFHDLAFLNYDMRVRTHICKNLDELFKFYSRYNSHQTDEIKMFLSHDMDMFEKIFDSCNSFLIIQGVGGIEHSKFSPKIVDQLMRLDNRVVATDGVCTLMEYHL